MNNIELSPGIKEPLCGSQWVNQHYHDLDGWHPRIEITRPGSRHTITIKSEEAEKAAIKAMRGGKGK